MLLVLVVLALASIFIPMIWEKNSYPKHLIIQRHAEHTPEQIITSMPEYIAVKAKALQTSIPYAWVIQLTSTSDVDKATQLEQTIKDMQYPAYTELSTDNKELVRVMVGPFATEQQAKKISEILNDKFQVKSMVTQYKTKDIEEISS